MILITGAHKAFALYKAIEEGVSHMWTVSAFQQHPRTVFVCDEDATLELKVKTVKYFKGEGRQKVGMAVGGQIWGMPGVRSGPHFLALSIFRDNSDFNKNRTLTVPEYRVIALPSMTAKVYFWRPIHSKEAKRQ